MILNSTYSNKKNTQLINDLVGNQFSFFETLKKYGIGSKRMVISEASPNLSQCLNTVSDVNYANIELRKKGILIHINKGLSTFTWAIPFYQLVMYKTNGASIHAQGKYLHFKNNKTFKENKNFFSKMLDEKIKYDMQYNFQSL